MEAACSNNRHHECYWMAELPSDETTLRLRDYWRSISISKRVEVAKVPIQELLKKLKGCSHNCTGCQHCYYAEKGNYYNAYLAFLSERGKRFEGTKHSNITIEEIYKNEESIQSDSWKCCTDFVFDVLCAIDNHLLPFYTELKSDDFPITLKKNLEKTPTIVNEVKTCSECKCALNLQATTAILTLKKVFIF